jgi:hypothetical protein
MLPDRDAMKTENRFQLLRYESALVFVPRRTAGL